jgi:hypothetical protein
MTQTALHRRTFLRGAGVILGLPMLHAMRPAALAMQTSLAGAAAANTPTRMACIFFPNGVIGPKWFPSGEGDQWELSSALEPLAPWKQKLNVVSGLTLDNGRAKEDGAGDHARAAATYLTAARPVKSSSLVRVGVSVDQLAAQQLVGVTRLPSIELGLKASRNAGSCDSGYSCAYSSNISWRTATQPMAKEVDPRQAFERLFGTGEADGGERAAFRKSVLDMVAQDAQRLMGRLGKTDRRKMDEYFTGIRELELRIERTEQEDLAARPDLELPEERPSEFDEHARLMYDIMAVGFQTDSTRVATLMLDNAGGERAYTAVGVKEGHHSLSHHQNNEEMVSKLERIDRYLAENFTYFLNKLDSIPDGDGTLLDNSLIMFGSALGDGNRHTHHDLPIVLAGQAGGQMRTGRHIVLPSETPMANLFLTMLDYVGTPIDSMADSSGRLSTLSS